MKIEDKFKLFLQIKEQGQTAFREGYDIKDNPYSNKDEHEQPLYMYWNEGWRIQKKLDKDKDKLFKSIIG